MPLLLIVSICSAVCQRQTVFTNYICYRWSLDLSSESPFHELLYFFIFAFLWNSFIKQRPTSQKSLWKLTGCSSLSILSARIFSSSSRMSFRLSFICFTFPINPTTCFTIRTSGEFRLRQKKSNCVET